ncbi:MAG: hypothetical protein ACLQQ4_07400 [Bacteroidia bacterium]
MAQTLTPDNANRMTLGLALHNNISYEEAKQLHKALTLILKCGDEIITSLPLQAALLTALNTGKRSFLGGLRLILPKADIPIIVPGYGQGTLDEYAEEAQVEIIEHEDEGFCLLFGMQAKHAEQLQVVCSDWLGGFILADDKITVPKGSNLPLGGIIAGALAVSAAFFYKTGIDKRVVQESAGISLWRPDLHWLHADAVGPAIDKLPKKFWVLGLGHLGQAYLWCIGQLPYPNPSEITIVLQDDDILTDANIGTGLLSEQQDMGKRKTRTVSKWLEARGFNTVITERRFDVNTIRSDDEPYMALCGFDNSSSRTLLENAGFDLVVEAGLGGKLSSFDKMNIHTFPNTYKEAKNIWTLNDDSLTDPDPVLKELLSSEELDECGKVLIASKAISTSFVGAFAGAVVLAETLRASNRGARYDVISSRLRNMKGLSAFLSSKPKYEIELVKNGFVNM